MIARTGWWMNQRWQCKWCLPSSLGDPWNMWVSHLVIFLAVMPCCSDSFCSSCQAKLFLMVAGIYSDAVHLGSSSKQSPLHVWIGWTESLWGAGRNLAFSMRALTLPFLHVISGSAVNVWRWMPVYSGSAFPFTCCLLSMHGLTGKLVKKKFGWLDTSSWITKLFHWTLSVTVRVVLENIFKIAEPLVETRVGCWVGEWEWKESNFLYYIVCSSLQKPLDSL